MPTARENSSRLNSLPMQFFIGPHHFAEPAFVLPSGHRISLPLEVLHFPPLAVKAGQPAHLDFTLFYPGEDGAPGLSIVPAIAKAAFGRQGRDFWKRLFHPGVAGPQLHFT